MRPRPEMEYSAIKESELENLVDDVNRAIKEGWRPQGGVCGWTEESGTFWAQAMIRENQ
jgi:hypothetical protein